MSDPSGSQDRTNEAAWERAWSARYEKATPAGVKRPGPRGRRRHASLGHLLIATAMLGTFISSIAIAQSSDGGASDVRQAGGAAGVGDPITLGERNPRSGGSSRETSIVADAGDGGLVLRPSNTAKGGRAISATCDNDGVTDEDGCAVYVNKGTGAAATFRTQGSVPFALRDTNTGRVPFLNADMVDGRHVSELLTQGEASRFLGATAKAADSETLDGRDSSDFLGASSKAADADTLDGQNASAFLGATAKATDADKLDGLDSYDVLKAGGFVQADGTPGNTNFPFTVFTNTTGKYTVTYPAGTFEASGQSCSTLVPVVTTFGTVRSTATIESTGCQSNGGGQFTVRTWNDAGGAANLSFLFVVYAFDS